MKGQFQREWVLEEQKWAEKLVDTSGLLFVKPAMENRRAGKYNRDGIKKVALTWTLNNRVQTLGVKASIRSVLLICNLNIGWEIEGRCSTP